MADQTGAQAQFVPPPLDKITKQLTLRALLTGMILGGLLSVCNIYTGLLIGWGTNMSVTGILLAFALWHAISGVSGRRVQPLTMHENNINQSACSAAAAVSSAGLVAPIPAMTMITGETLSWAWLSIWVFVVCLVGITAAIGLRKQMIVIDQLPFPGGMACAATLKEIHGKGQDAMRRVGMMGIAALVAGLVKVGTIVGLLKNIALPFTVKGHSAKSLGFDVEPNLLMVGVGGLIGVRGCVSLMLASVIGWGICGPHLINAGYADLSVSTPLLVQPNELSMTAPEANEQRQAVSPEDRKATMLLKAEYRTAQHALRIKGIIDDERLPKLLSISPDPMYKEAVLKLRTDSQLRIAAPLPAVPSGVDLAALNLSYDDKAKELVAAGAVGPAIAARALAASEDPAWRSAVEKIGAWFTYRVTQPMQVHIPLEVWPKDLTVPQRYAGVLGYSKAKQAVVAKGRISAEVEQEVRRRAEALAESHPGRAEEYRAAMEAVSRAVAASRTMSLPGLEGLPESLAGRVLFDADKAKITVVGPLGGSEQAALAGLSEDAGFKSAVDAVAAASQYRPARANTGDMLEWMLWPGVSMMVISSLTSLAFSGKAIMRAFRRTKTGDEPVTEEDTGDVRRQWFLFAVVTSLVLAVAVQAFLFDIKVWAAVVGVALSFLLAVVGSRVSGETNVTPIGAMGKVTQLVFGVIAPSSPSANLMAANVTGGAASQCADLMHDLKCGYIIGATARLQVISQIGGALAGSLLGSFFYLVLIPNPKEQLMTEQWPAPAVATWKAVAELFMVGFEAIPKGTPMAMLIAGVIGLVLPILEKLAPKSLKVFIPSAAAMGLALVILPRSSISMLIGAMIAFALSKVFPKWTDRFLVTICAGLIAGESLTGAGDALRLLFFGN